VEGLFFSYESVVFKRLLKSLSLAKRKSIDYQLYSVSPTKAI